MENDLVEVSSEALNVKEPEPTPQLICALQTRFKIRDEWYNIVHCSSQPESNFTSYVTGNGTRVNVVVLGSKRHFAILADAIHELNTKIKTNELAFLDPNISSDNIRRRDIENRLKKLEAERTQRLTELAFLQENVSFDSESTANDESMDDGFDFGDTFGVSDSTSNVDSELPPQEVLHVTAENFGSLQRLKIIKHEKTEGLFKIPKPRQYFIGDVLHRENEHMKVAWLELFSDLVYVGAIGKAGHLISENGYSWMGVLEFVLVMVPIFYRWKSFIALQNMIHHEDLTRKIYAFFYNAIIVLMVISIEYSFSKDESKNTGNLFIALHLVDGLLIDVYLGIAGMFFKPMFRRGIFYRMIPNLCYIIPYLVLLGLPVDGTKERWNTRIIIWSVAVLIELVVPFTMVLILPRSIMQHRVALNIEHYSERHGLMIVIVLGELVIRFLSDYSRDQTVLLLIETMLAFFISLSLFFLYFRAEQAKHFQHALRRSKWTGIGWSAIHVPLILTLIIFAVCIYGLISISAAEELTDATSTPLDYEFQTILSSSFAAVYLCLSVLAELHLDVNPDPTVRRARKERVANITRRNRIFSRLLVGLVFLILGLTIRLSARGWLLLTSCISILSVALEEVGRLTKTVSRD
ncbi:hypothetical protein HDU91_007273 [Kappamyces sp. JEL0680]|nr:hypothetical protein HDU91_007273 [Kappamyces sp. JEL0680]